jgi:hypothetical protein
MFPRPPDRRLLRFALIAACAAFAATLATSQAARATPAPAPAPATPHASLAAGHATFVPPIPLRWLFERLPAVRRSVTIRVQRATWQERRAALLGGEDSAQREAAREAAKYARSQVISYICNRLEDDYGSYEAWVEAARHDPRAYGALLVCSAHGDV